MVFRTQFPPVTCAYVLPGRPFTVWREAAGYNLMSTGVVPFVRLGLLPLQTSITKGGLSGFNVRLSTTTVRHKKQRVRDRRPCMHD